mmetsp:Transcript_13490/g.31734  ORF Transcript_13490/g.31734 Transcript_13490/m.31734 type:complete len:270 (+) Transcript_13490:761-1570(+)
MLLLLLLHPHRELGRRHHRLCLHFWHWDDTIYLRLHQVRYRSVDWLLDLLHHFLRNLDDALNRDFVHLNPGDLPHNLVNLRHLYESILVLDLRYLNDALTLLDLHPRDFTSVYLCLYWSRNLLDDLLDLRNFYHAVHHHWLWDLNKLLHELHIHFWNLNDSLVVLWRQLVVDCWLHRARELGLFVGIASLPLPANAIRSLCFCWSSTCCPLAGASAACKFSCRSPSRELSWSPSGVLPARGWNAAIFASLIHGVTHGFTAITPSISVAL